MTTETVKPAKAAEAVARHIEGLILEGSLRPGEKLPAERELAERLVVSRPTLREGLRSLQQEGLLTREAGGGAAVAMLRALSDASSTPASTPAARAVGRPRRPGRA